MNKVPRLDAPTGPLWHSEQIEIRTDGHERVAVVNMVWEMQADGEYFLQPVTHVIIVAAVQFLL